MASRSRPEGLEWRLLATTIMTISFLLLVKEALKWASDYPGAGDPTTLVISLCMNLVLLGWWTCGRRSKKPVLAVDFDEVCVGYLPAFIRFNNEVYKTELSISDFHSYRFWEVSKCGLASRDEAISRVYEFHKSPYFDQIEPIPGAREGLTLLRRKYELHIVTSRQDDIAAQTRKYVARHFPKLFAGLHFGNHFGKTGSSVSKPAMCAVIGAVALIDDSVEYAQQCAAAPIPIPTFLFGEYGWNNDAACGGRPLDRERICRVANWSEVVKALRIK